MLRLWAILESDHLKMCKGLKSDSGGQPIEEIGRDLADAMETPGMISTNTHNMRIGDFGRGNFATAAVKSLQAVAACGS